MKKSKLLIILFIFSLILIFLSIRNILIDCEKFFEFNLLQIMTFMSAIWIAYYFNKKNENNKNLKNKYFDILKDLTDKITQLNKMITSDNFIWSEFLLEDKLINNKLTFLEEFSGKFELKESVKVLKTRYEDLRNFISEECNGKDCNLISTNYKKIFNSLMTDIDNIILNFFKNSK